MLKAVVGTENIANEYWVLDKMWAGEFSFRSNKNYRHFSHRDKSQNKLMSNPDSSIYMYCHPEEQRNVPNNISTNLYQGTIVQLISLGMKNAGGNLSHFRYTN